MLYNYIKMALRSLWRNKLSSFINIGGLAVAIAVCIMGYLTIEQFYSQDNFHINGSEIFMLTHTHQVEENEQVWGDTPIPLGPALERDFPQVVRAVRIEFAGATVRRGDEIFDEGIVFADTGFFSMFTFPLRLGKPAALRDHDGIIISAEAAKRYFGEENPMFQPIELILPGREPESFIVKGVLEKMPDNASLGIGERFQGEFLFSFDRLKDFKPDVDEVDWATEIEGTFVQVKKGVDPSAFIPLMQTYLEASKAASLNHKITGFGFESLERLAMNEGIRGGISQRANQTEPAVVVLVCGLLLLLACFNYINITLASISDRMKEIGIRKVIGGRRVQLIVQFLGENLVLCTFALLFGIVIAEVFLIPMINQLTRGFLNLTIHYSSSSGQWIFFLVLLGGTSILAGIYPAVFISGLQPVRIFRGRTHLSRKNRFTSVLLTLQFIFSFSLIAAGIIFAQNGSYMQKRDWGYGKDQIMVVPVRDNQYFERFRNEVEQHPDILSTTGAESHVGSSRRRGEVKVDGRIHEVDWFGVGPGYIETMGLRLKQGRSFNSGEDTEEGTSALVNSTFAKLMGWDQPLGQRFEYENKTYTVIGELADFHALSFFQEIQPTFIHVVPDSTYRYLAVKMATDKTEEISGFLASTWKKQVAVTPYLGYFQDEVFFSYFISNKINKDIFSFLATIALILSCMGLFGLVSLNLARRRKELSIRKVMGASMKDVARLVNRPFIWVLGIAILIATPLSYVGLASLLDQIYTYHIEIGISPFIYAGLLIIGTALLTISSQLYIMIRSNPVEALREE